MVPRLTFLSAVLLLPAVAAASGSHHHHHAPASHAQPYAGQQQREIKSLSDAEQAALLNGEGMGYAKAAELNGFPGPAHVLELADELALDATQRDATEQLLIRHKQRARELGAAVIEAERRLDLAFAHRHVDEQRITALSLQAAELQAALRAEHLSTHLAQTRLLTAAQVLKYQEMRGYVAGRSGTK